MNGHRPLGHQGEQNPAYRPSGNFIDTCQPATANPLESFVFLGMGSLVRYNPDEFHKRTLREHYFATFSIQPLFHEEKTFDGDLS